MTRAYAFRDANWHELRFATNLTCRRGDDESDAIALFLARMFSVLPDAVLVDRQETWWLVELPNGRQFEVWSK